MTTRSFITRIILFALLFSGAAHAQAPVTLRIATIPIDTGAEAFYAADLGFFKKAGLDVQITILNNGAAIAAAMAGGSFDVGQANVPALAAAREAGLPFALIAPASVYTQKTPATAGIVVGKSTDIHSARDLNGKVIAVSGLSGIGQITTQQWIDKNGGDSSTVHWVDMPFAQMTAALTAGRIDAAESAYPALDETVQAGHRLLDPGYEATAREFMIAGWFCKTDFIDSHPDVVRRLVRVFAETARWANTHHAESAAILQKWTKQIVLPSTPRVYYGETVSIAEVQPIIDVTYKYHGLKTPLSAIELVSPLVLPGRR